MNRVQNKQKKRNKQNITSNKNKTKTCPTKTTSTYKMQNGANCRFKKIESRHKFVTLIHAIQCTYISQSFASKWKWKTKSRENFLRKCEDTTLVTIYILYIEAKDSDRNGDHDELEMLYSINSVLLNRSKVDKACMN